MSKWAVLKRYETMDGSVSFELPTRQAEWQSTQELQWQAGTIHGAHYGHDPFGMAAAPAAPAQERWRSTLSAEDGDVARSLPERIPKGRLWIEMDDGSERWAIARLTQMPEFTISGPNISLIPTVFPFTRLSDWYAAEASVDQRTTTASSFAFQFNVGGMAVTRNIVMTLMANTSGGYDNPVIRNTTTGEQVQLQVNVSRVAQTGDMVRLDVLNFRLEESTDGGSTWGDRTDVLILGNTQVSPLSLQPGGNTIAVTNEGDEADLDIEVTYFEAWR